jgi:hypothetical protein
VSRVGVLRIDGDGVSVFVVADERAEDLLRLGEAVRVVERVAEVVVDARELTVLGELDDDALVERDRRAEPLASSSSEISVSSARARSS